MLSHTGVVSPLGDVEMNTLPIQIPPTGFQSVAKSHLRGEVR